MKRTNQMEIDDWSKQVPAKTEDGTVVLAEDKTGTFATPFIQVYSGKLISLTDPTPDDIDINDVAAALSKINRYTGHTRLPYSVAQHSLWCSYHVKDKGLALHALLHDAPETYIGDISRPLKLLFAQLHPGLIAGLDAKFEEAVFLKAGLEWPYDEEIGKQIKAVDNWALSTEKRDLMPRSRKGEAWPGMPRPHRDKIVPEDPDVNEKLFLQRYEELGGK